MSQVKSFYNRYFSRLNKYWLVFIIFLIMTFTVGDSTLYLRYEYDRKIRELEKEISFHKKNIAKNRKKIEDLHANKERLERYAREEFFMKKQNEDVFIIK
ncbi:MAG: septum formation initiator family protein [Tannerella sp.]|jgi:cell division protein FtsB|nr:septum formation initiator family protein [Tannerella sp.]